MTQICDQFKTTFHRPLKRWDEVSLAELVQFTEIMTDSLYDAEDTIRQQWVHELDKEHDMNYLTEKEFRVRFVDGSYLIVKK